MDRGGGKLVFRSLLAASLLLLASQFAGCKVNFVASNLDSTQSLIQPSPSPSSSPSPSDAPVDVVPKFDSDNNSSGYRINLFNAASDQEVADAKKTFLTLSDHPRIFSGQAKLQLLAAKINSKTDSELSDWFDHFKSFVENVIYPGGLVPSVPVYSPGGTDHSISTNMNTARAARTAIEYLAVSHAIAPDSLGRDVAFAKSLVLTLAGSGFPDWSPTTSSFHILADHARAVAFGYSQFYSSFSTDELHTIQLGLLNKAILPALDVFAHTCKNTWTISPPGCDNSFWWVASGMNISTMSYEGIVEAALAIADVYPDPAAKALANSVKGLQLVGTMLVDHGAAGSEGTLYAQATARHLVLVIETLRAAYATAQPTDFGLTALYSSYGLEELGNFLAAVGGVGSKWINFGDADQPNWTDNALLWIANTFQRADLAQVYVQLIKNKMATGTRTDPEDLLFYSDLFKQKATLQHSTVILGTDYVVLRKNVLDADAFTAAIEGGRAGWNHKKPGLGTVLVQWKGINWIRTPGYSGGGNSVDSNTIVFNDTNQGRNDWAGIVQYELGTNHLFGILDLSHTQYTTGAWPGTPGPIDSSQGQFWRRGLRIPAPQLQLVSAQVQDEFEATAGTPYTYNLHTDATVLISGSQVMLTQNQSNGTAQKFLVRVLEPTSGITWSSGASGRISFSGTAKGGAERISVLLHGCTDINCTVQPEEIQIQPLNLWSH